MQLGHGYNDIHLNLFLLGVLLNSCAPKGHALVLLEFTVVTHAYKIQTSSPVLKVKCDWTIL